MKTLFQTFKNQIWIFAVIIFLAINCGGLYLYLSPKKYASETTISIPLKAQQFGNIKLFPSSQTTTTEEITSVPFLKEALKDNASLIRYYIKKDFTKESTNYRFPYNINYRVSGAPDFNTQHYSITTLNATSFQITSTIHGISRTKNGTFGDELIDNNIILTVTKKTTSRNESYLLMAPEYLFTIESPLSMAQKLVSAKQNLMVTDSDGLLKISCRSDNPDHAKAIAQAITNKILGKIKESNNSMEDNTEVQQLNIQLQTISDQLSETEYQIAQFKKSNNITELEYDTEKSLAVMRELQLQKTNLEMKMAALDNLSNYLRKNRDSDNSMAEYGAIDDQQFTNQMALLNEKYQLKNSGNATKTTDAEIELIKSSIAERILNTRKRTAVQIEGLQHAIHANQKNLWAIPEKASALMALDRKLQLDKKVYELMSDKRALAIVNMQTPATNMRVLKPAYTPITPVSPNPLVVMGTCLLLGIIAGWPVARFREYRKTLNINKREQIDELQTLPFMGTIESGENLLTSVNNLCTKIMMRPDAKTITFASAGNTEGKSFIASRLSQALSAMDKKVLLLDMDLCNPQLAEIFHSTPPNSLADVIQGNCDIHDAICLTSFPNLELLIAGNLLSGINTLISSEKKNEIFNTLKKHFDYIIINTSEITNNIDAIPLMKMSDLNLFVVRANTSRKQSLVLAAQVKNDFEITNLFCLLNNASDNTSERKSRTRNRNININREKTEKSAFVPDVLRRIALWFY